MLIFTSISLRIDLHIKFNYDCLFKVLPMVVFLAAPLLQDVIRLTENYTPANKILCVVIL